MQEEWLKVISEGRVVEFTYLALPNGDAFLTAQIAGHEVVHSVIVTQTEHPSYNSTRWRKRTPRRRAWRCNRRSRVEGLREDARVASGQFAAWLEPQLA